MTEIIVVPRPRHSKEFTIDSIIGRHNEKSEPSTSQNSREKFRVIENVHMDRSHREEVDIKSANALHEVLPDRHVRDLRDLRGYVASRDMLATMIPGESMRHFQDLFLQNTVPCRSSRIWGHPPSSFNIHGMHSQQIPALSPFHPMVFSSMRDYRHMYPYLAEKSPGYFMPRFGGKDKDTVTVLAFPGTPGLHFHPYRKPKRIRTAFLPFQLQQLEKAFDKSHYVVGQERKDLASKLQLSETQVKVWFQNRRTKVKRVKTEDEESNCHSHGQKSNKSLDLSIYRDSDSECHISDIDN
ncbi:hypothetical protein CHS0354_003349 [Potamilus streckersoni]|uniref:Homeobox domain-containing protein n=1 Tax=Potamilus streckersoni TaxID=2493646 RepID=A0AAE0VQI0_9BIVA|nr:hypothetical protein CHS0354_003349 [Potamilus streckersoni]